MRTRRNPEIVWEKQPKLLDFSAHYPLPRAVLQCIPNNVYLPSDFLKPTPFKHATLSCLFRPSMIQIFHQSPPPAHLTPPGVSHLILVLHLPSLSSFSTGFPARTFSASEDSPSHAGAPSFPSGFPAQPAESWHPHTLNPHQTGFFSPVFPCPTGFQSSSPTFCFPGFRCLLPIPSSWFALLLTALQNIPPPVKSQGQSLLFQPTSSTRPGLFLSGFKFTSFKY